ncbi:MAG: HlyD family secretion protein, partial [Chlamydiia bacterium]|nr:HlyD family secretion protein [Chlamydiia bacterium]
MNVEVKKRGKRGWYLITGIILLVLIAFGVGFHLVEDDDIVWTNDAFIDTYRIDLSPDILGRVVELRVDEGDVVKQGDVVAVLLQDIYQSQKLEAEAALESAVKQVAFEEAHFEKIKNDYLRATQAIQDQIISSQDFDHFQKDYEMAAASLKKAVADTVLAESKVALINTYLDHTYIYAPFNGVIAKRWIFTGDVMRPGQALFTMYDRERVWVQANLSETKIKRVKLGDPVEITVDAYPGKTFYGKVFTIKSAAASQFSVIPQNNATGNYTKVAQRIPVKISIDSMSADSKLYLFPGMNVE